MADIIESGDLARLMPTQVQKDEALKALVTGLDRPNLMELSEANNPSHTGSYKTCLAMKAMYQRLLSLPEPNKEIALRTLLDRR